MNHKSLNSTNKHLRDRKKREEIATRFALSSSRIEGIRPSSKLRKQLTSATRNHRS